MAQSNFFLKQSTEKSDTERLCMQVTHKGLSLDIDTHYSVRPDEWDAAMQCFILNDDSTGRKRQLNGYKQGLTRTAKQVESIIRDLERSGDYTVHDIATGYNSFASEIKRLDVYAMHLADEMDYMGYKRTARAYGTTISRLLAFIGGREVKLEDITADLMKDFQRSLKKEGVSMNTLSFYMRNLRAIYNKAVSEGLIPKRLDSPFDEVYTEVRVQKSKQTRRQ